MIGIIIWIAVGLLAIGYLRSIIGSQKPGFVMDIQKVLNEWISGNKWMSYFAPFFALPLLLFNLIAWIVFGLMSVAELIAFLFVKVWWGVQWVWYEVLHPTIFALLRLLWHYVVVWAFRFFRNAVLLIPEGLKKENIFFAWRKLIVPALVSMALIIIYLLTYHIIVLVLVMLMIFYMFQHAVFISVAHLRKDEFDDGGVYPALKLSVLWLGFSSVATALMVLIKQFSDVYIISALSITLIQLLLPVAVVFGFAFVLTTFYLPAYMKEYGYNAGIIDFWRTTIKRLPRLIVSQPYQLIGLAVSAIIPLIIFLGLNAGVKNISGSGFCELGSRSLAINYHIPAIRENVTKLENIGQDREDIINSGDERLSAARGLVSSMKAELDGAIAMKEAIKDNAIHTFDRAAYVGEMQSFSIPEVTGCRDYQWKIINAQTKSLVRLVKMPGGEGSGSSVFYHQWRAPGKYIVSLIQPRGCGTGVEPSLMVEVLPATDSLVIPESSYFVSREAAIYAIDLLNAQIEEAEIALKNIVEDRNSQLLLLSDVEVLYQFLANENRHMLVAKIFTLLGLTLLAVLFAGVLWTYFVTYHFDIYAYGHEGKHFFTKLGEEIKSRNPLQPWLGIFVLIIVASIILLIIYQGQDIGNWIDKLLSLF